ncbi:MAG: LPS export ABC transporter permease LptG [Alphaproteobacteria bacterium]
MNLSSTFSLYVVSRFAIAIIGILLACLALVYAADLMELSRRASGKQGITFTVLATMALFKLPSMAERLFPFAILFGSMIAFLQMTRRQELVVARASGISIWQFAFPAVGFVFVLGVASVVLYNPMASRFNAAFERLDATVLKGRSGGILQNSRNGLWLRQANSQGAAVLYAQKATNRGLELFEVMVLEFDRDEKFLRRVEAARATLRDGAWRLTDAWVARGGEKPVFMAQYDVETFLTKTQVVESLASPTSISFWDLPKFIEIATKAGLSAKRYRVHYQFLLAQPFLFCSMVLVAATFSLRLFRLGHITRMVVSGILAGFALFLASFISRALGGNGTIPPFIAAWWPAVIASLASLTVLFFQEDG